MAQSKCPRCESTRFELALADHIKNANYKLFFIQCASCGTVVGTTDYQSAPALIHELAKKLGVRLD